jgi:carbonic anhydrase
MMFSSRDHPVLVRLLSTNDEWSRDVEKVEPGFFRQLSKGQKPQVTETFHCKKVLIISQVLWIGCSDSRAPESVLCAVPPGEIFVTRNVAK